MPALVRAVCINNVPVIKTIQVSRNKNNFNRFPCSLDNISILTYYIMNFQYFTCLINKRGSPKLPPEKNFKRNNGRI